MVGPFKFEEAVEFAENPEPRCPCVLLLDVSKSMRGEAIDSLNEGLVAFRNELIKDPLATRRVEIAMVTFGRDVKVMQNFLPVDRFTPQMLTAAGLTPMGTAINKALDLLEERKSVYKTHGVPYYRPWVFMITDGKPKGEPDAAMEEAVRRLRKEEDQKHVVFFAVAVRGAWTDKLKQIAVRPPVKLDTLNFVELFVWLSRSTQQNAHKQLPLPPASAGEKNPYDIR